jgi:hypothetical protein
MLPASARGSRAAAPFRADPFVAAAFALAEAAATRSEPESSVTSSV